MRTYHKLSQDVRVWYWSNSSFPPASFLVARWGRGWFAIACDTILWFERIFVVLRSYWRYSRWRSAHWGVPVPRQWTTFWSSRFAITPPSAINQLKTCIFCLCTLFWLQRGFSRVYQHRAPVRNSPPQFLLEIILSSYNVNVSFKLPKVISCTTAIFFAWAAPAAIVADVDAESMQTIKKTQYLYEVVATGIVRCSSLKR